jgi:2-dehydropantoate 2-reductase
MRFVIIGLGGVGGTVAGKLHLAGFPVIGVARGAHLAAIRRDGLQLVTPEGTHQVHLPTVERPAEIDWTGDEVVILAVKGQHTTGVIEDLRPVLPAGVPILATQNGVDNERSLLRVFPHVYGVYVVLPGTHVEPGQVIVNSAPVYGVLDVGRYPSGTDEVTREVTAAFRHADFESREVADIQRWKYAKLRVNLANGVEAICGADALSGPIAAEVLAEADRVLALAGVEVTSGEEQAERGRSLSMREIDGVSRPGNSTFQSMMRDTGSTEVDFLNGEIVLLGRLLGEPAPANAAVTTVLDRMAREHRPAGSLSQDELQAEIDRAAG